MSARTLPALLTRRAQPAAPSLPQHAAIDRSFARFRSTATDSRLIAAEADRIRQAEELVHGRPVLDDFDRWERATFRVLVMASATLRDEQVAAARANGEDRCCWCTGLTLDAEVEAVGDRLVHADPCLAQFDAWTRGEG